MSAVELVERARAMGVKLAVAESLTGGSLAAAIVAVPGASQVLRLGVVAYATSMKREVLGVNGRLLADRGAVDPDVAAQMADGVRRLAESDGSACDFGIATTGVAGPASQDGHEAGEFFVAIASSERTTVTRSVVAGGRAEVREAAVAEALRLFGEQLAAGHAES